MRSTLSPVSLSPQIPKTKIAVANQSGDSVGGIFDQQSSNDKKRTSNVNIQDIDIRVTKRDITEEQRPLIETITKRMVLVSFCVITSMIYLIFVIIRLNLSGSINEISVHHNYFRIWGLINNQTNIICLLLQFSFYQDKKYRKYCRVCHTGCQDCVSYFVVRNMKQKYHQDAIRASNIRVKSHSPNS